MGKINVKAFREIFPGNSSPEEFQGKVLILEHRHSLCSLFAFIPDIKTQNSRRKIHGNF